MDLKQMHFDVLEGRSDYIPLIINTKPEGASLEMFAQPKTITPWEIITDPQKHIDTYLYNNQHNIKFPTDRELYIESSFVESLIPSMFGAEVYKSAGGYVDVKPIINDIEQAEGLEVCNGQLDMALEHIKYLKKNTPEDIKVTVTRFLGPLDSAVVMRGGDFYLDLLVEPEKSIAFLNKITDLTIKTFKYFNKEINQDHKEQIVGRGLYFHGTRLTGDAIVNVSPDLIKTVLHPIFSRFKEELGGLMLHYCCLPAPSGHVLPALAECGSIRCVDNWQGYESFFNKKQDGLLQDKVAMCCDVTIEEIESVEKLMEKPLFRDVKRKGGRGLVVMTSTNDIERSKRAYDNWKNYFERK